MSAKRFYAQCTEISAIFETRWQTAWQVFDRNRLSLSGEAQPIALCADQKVALQIRDAMNERNT